MFVRQVTAHYKPGKFDLLNRRLENDIIPLLRKQTGFRDELAFFDKEKDEAVAMSFWDTKQDAEMYQRDIYPKVSEKMQEAIEGTPKVRAFEVNNSTWYDIHAA
jgi:heme-degrading monooxygenase HmoA